MSKHRDYTRFSKPESSAPEIAVETVMETVTETAVETVVETVTEPEIVNEPEPTIGVVTNCVRLNVREDSEPNAKIVGSINASTELVIDMAESTDEFYKIITSAGIEGFCVKKYITIMP